MNGIAIALRRATAQSHHGNDLYYRPRPTTTTRCDTHCPCEFGCELSTTTDWRGLRCIVQHTRFDVKTVYKFDGKAIRDTVTATISSWINDTAERAT